MKLSVNELVYCVNKYCRHDKSHIKKVIYDKKLSRFSTGIGENNHH